MDSEMMRAIEADGEKLRNLTGEDHGPYFLYGDGDVKCVNAHDRCYGGAGGPCPYCERPVVAPQQPRAVQPAVQPVDAFRNMFAILHNLEDGELEFLTHKQRLAMRDNPAITILRLDDARLDALYNLVQKQQPEPYRGIV